MRGETLFRAEAMCETYHKLHSSLISTGAQTLGPAKPVRIVAERCMTNFLGVKRALIVSRSHSPPRASPPMDSYTLGEAPCLTCKTVATSATSCGPSFFCLRPAYLKAYQRLAP